MKRVFLRPSSARIYRITKALNYGRIDPEIAVFSLQAYGVRRIRAHRVASI